MMQRREHEESQILILLTVVSFHIFKAAANVQQFVEVLKTDDEKWAMI